MLEDRDMERTDVGEMPIEAAARHPQGFRHRVGLERRKAVLGQDLQPAIEPVLSRKLIGHLRPLRHLTIHYCIDTRQPSPFSSPYSSVWRAKPMRDLLLQSAGLAAIAVALILRCAR